MKIERKREIENDRIKEKRKSDIQTDRKCQVASSVVSPIRFPYFLWFLIALIEIRFMPIFGGTLRDPNRRRCPFFLFRD